MNLAKLYPWVLTFLAIRPLLGAPPQKRPVDMKISTAADPAAFTQDMKPLKRPIDLQISTGDAEIDRACELGERTLRMNVSEKWGKLCPVVAPAWGKCYPAWVHVFDNFWMTKVTPYLYPKDQAEWPLILMAKYQWPNGMVSGVEAFSPEAFQAQLAEMGEEKIKQHSNVGQSYGTVHLYVMEAYDLWWHYGDLEFARRIFPTCRKAFGYLYSFNDRDQDGLIESADLLEDVFIGSDNERTSPDADERFIDQALLYGALMDYAKLADVLGEKAEAEWARSRSEALAKKVNELYWNDKGYYIFALDSKTHKPLHEEVTSTYGDGYGILWGLVPPDRIARVLDYLTSWKFEVPGPILVPALDMPTGGALGQPKFAPGFYVNGGCGWGRGHLPSVCLALFAHGREETAIDYLRKMAKAANQAGAFHEYWTWEKYTGFTKPSGCRNYSETASAFLDSVIHGYFGLSALEPGWRSLRFAPKPIPGKECSITVGLPGGGFTVALKKTGKGWNVDLNSDVERTVEVAPPGTTPQRVTVKGKRTVDIQ